ncbi:MarR family transcriptional regulator [Cellulomonas sp. Root930]|nr:MarR family transcriptional regulator [Cellulomonas sp. Root930]
MPVNESGELLELLHGVLRGVRRDAAAQLEVEGTTPGQLRMLRTLDRCDGPCRLGELAAALDVAPRSVTSKVDAAEADGLVQRMPDPTDRRATLLELTPAGRSLLAAISAQRHEGAAERLGRLSPEDQAELLRLLRVVGD